MKSFTEFDDGGRAEGMRARAARRQMAMFCWAGWNLIFAIQTVREQMKRLMNRIEGFWCIYMHDRVMWPIHGYYRCGVCVRKYQAFAEVEERSA